VLDRCKEDERRDAYADDLWAALRRRLGLPADPRDSAADAEAVPTALPPAAGVVEPGRIVEPGAEVADEPGVDGAEVAAGQDAGMVAVRFEQRPGPGSWRAVMRRR
jgi:hypothetical protein